MRDPESEQSPRGRDLILTGEPDSLLSESHAVLWSIVIIASVLDILTTITGLEHGLREGNIVARAFIDVYGTPGIGLLKFSALVLVVILWGVLRDRHATIVLGVFAVVSLIVVALNTITLIGL